MGLAVIGEGVVAGQAEDQWRHAEGERDLARGGGLIRDLREDISEESLAISFISPEWRDIGFGASPDCAQLLLVISAAYQIDQVSLDDVALFRRKCSKCILDHAFSSRIY
jgi:hypothetical protein